MRQNGRIAELEREVRDLSQALIRLQNYLRIAANYQNSSSDARLDGIQAALLKAAEVKARDGRKRR